jgi:hypothetical protein
MSTRERLNYHIKYVYDVHAGRDFFLFPIVLVRQGLRDISLESFEALRTLRPGASWYVRHPENGNELFKAKCTVNASVSRCALHIRAVKLVLSICFR